MIACSDERSVAAKFFYRRSIRAPCINDWLLHDMFKERLLIDTYLVKLIHINQQKTIQIQLRIPFPAKVNAIRIVRLQTRR